MKKLSSVLTLLLILLASRSLHAQTISVDKTSLSLTAVAGGSPVSATVNVSSSGTNQGFVTGKTAAWLTVTSGGQTPMPVTITADPTGLIPATYSDTVTITALTNTVRVNVTFTVSTIGISQSAVNFAYQSGGALPVPQPISVSGQPVSFSASPATTSGGNWLQVSPTQGVSPTTVSIYLNPDVVGPDMSPGTYNGTVTFTPTSGASSVPIAVAVTLTVTAAPPVTVNPSSVSLVYQIGGANNPAPQTVTLATTGTLPVAYGFAVPDSWISVSSLGGSIPANGSTGLTIGYNAAANLPAGSYTGKAILSTPGGAPTSQDIPVKLLVSSAPLLSVPNAALAFNYQVGGPTPAAQSVTASSTAVAPDATVGQMKLTITTSTNNTGNWLSVTTTNPVTGTPFMVAVNPAGMAPGTYNGSVTVTGADAANGPQTIPVTLKISNDPQIVGIVNGCNTLLQQAGCPVTFAYQTGQAAPLPQTLKLTSSTGVALNYTLTTSATSCGGNWLSVGGTTTGTTDASLPISVSPGTIAAGTKCDGSVVVSAVNPASGAAAPNSPVTIPVSLYVSGTPLLTVSPSALNFTTQTGGPAPAAQNITLNGTSATQPLNYSVTFTPLNSWLSVGPASGSTQTGSNLLTVSVLPLQLQPGTYTGTITVTATLPGGGSVADSPVTIPIRFAVTAGDLVLSQTALSFTQTLSGAASQPQTVNVTSNGQPLSYTATLSTGGSGDWLSISSAGGTTPGSFQVSADGSKLQPGTYHGNVTVTSTTPYAGNSPAVIPVTLVVNPGTISVTPASLTFTEVQNAPAQSQDVRVSGTPGSLAFTVTTATDNNSGSWLTAAPASGNTPATVHVTATAGALPVGQYTGTITITAPGSTQSVKVTLNVVAVQTMTVSPAAMNFAYTIGQQAPSPLTAQLAASGGITPFTVSASTKDGGNWLTATPTSGSTPATLTIAVNPQGLEPGNYTGSVSVASPYVIQQPLVTVNLTVAQVPKPVIGGVQNAASSLTGGFSPGENIVIYGTGIGPADLAKGKLTGTGVLDTNVSNTRVLFDGVAAPIIYVSAGQTSVMVPYGVSGRTRTNMVVEYSGVQSDSIPYNIVQVSPGIYTLNQAGTGPGAILNQDYSVNGSDRPAAKGSVVQVYATGEGITQPPSADGGIAPLNGTGLNTPVQAVTATVGGIPATVQYYGSAPGIVYGVMQVNVVIPANAPSGAAVPIQIAVGGVASQNNVTVAVK